MIGRRTDWPSEETWLDIRKGQSVQTGSGVHPVPYSTDTVAFLLQVKQPGREADHSSHLVPSLRMRGAIPPILLTLSWRPPCAEILQDVQEN